jgi:uncharacterized protein (DUF1697 family)
VTAWVLLLRGINVGGNNRLPMRDLAALLEGLGLHDVRTYIASGNVVFAADAPVDPRALAASITEAIRNVHGFAPRAMLLEASAVRAVVAHNPFPEAAPEPKTLHVLFLEAAPATPDLAGLEAVRGPRERFALDGAVLYLHVPEGLGRSELALRAERLLGVAATARNWNTVLALAGLGAGGAVA